MNESAASTLNLASVAPALTVGDLETSIAFYEGILGFEVVDRFEQAGVVLGASLRAGTVSLMLGQDDWAKGQDRVKGVGFRLYCETTQDVDELAAAIKSRGGELAQEPTDQPWGARDLAIVDPDGFTLSISSGVSAES
jgi:uncharacterized glyoxalase superfamily protein PhnB